MGGSTVPSPCTPSFGTTGIAGRRGPCRQTDGPSQLVDLPVLIGLAVGRWRCKMGPYRPFEVPEHADSAHADSAMGTVR